MSEEMITPEPGETDGQLPAWTPFARTGQIVTSNLPNTPDGVVWENSRYVVVVRDCGGGGEGKLIWLSIKNADNCARHDWREFKRIKNELVGTDVEAVELYPAESRLVDCEQPIASVVRGRLPLPLRLRGAAGLGGHARRHAASLRAGHAPCRPRDRADRRAGAGCACRRACTGVRRRLGSPAGRGAPAPRPRAALPAWANWSSPMTRPSPCTTRDRRRNPTCCAISQGDWGVQDDADRVANDLALQNGERLLSCYDLPTGEPIWIITEADRSATTITTPGEY